VAAVAVVQQGQVVLVKTVVLATIPVQEQAQAAAAAGPMVDPQLLEEQVQQPSVVPEVLVLAELVAVQVEPLPHLLLRALQIQVVEVVVVQQLQQVLDTMAKQAAHQMYGLLAVAPTAPPAGPVEQGVHQP
jgi:hypothetical protein